MTRHQSRVVIVGLTRTGGSFCVGGYDVDRRAAVRLGTHVSSASQYPLETWWRVDYSPDPNAEAPHTEDVIVHSARTARPVPDWSLRRVAAESGVWRGDMWSIFDGKAGRTANGSLYIDRSAALTRSVGFWYPTGNLALQGTHYHDASGSRLKYVGVAQPIPTIEAGTLVRVSLARWWRPDDSDFELRCYAQLSGWFSGLGDQTPPRGASRRQTIVVPL